MSAATDVWPAGDVWPELAIDQPGNAHAACQGEVDSSWAEPKNPWAPATKPLKRLSGVPVPQLLWNRDPLVKPFLAPIAPQVQAAARLPMQEAMAELGVSRSTVKRIRVKAQWPEWTV